MAKYKIVGLPKKKYQGGGKPDPKTMFYTVEGSDGVYRKVNGKWEVDWNRSGNFQPLSKGDVSKRTAVLNSQAKPLYDPVYDDMYSTQRQQFTSKPVNKPTTAKAPTAQDKSAQEAFNKSFQVTNKSKMEGIEDKIQKDVTDFIEYHNENYDEPLTTEEINDAYQNAYRSNYINAGVYKPVMSGPVANPYGTTELRKNLISLDPGKAPKNLTLGDYVEKGWDIVSNPLDYASYALKPKGTVNIPWNLTEYENRLEAAGLEDPVTANNNVNKAIDFASWFLPAGAAAQGLKMVPGTVNSIGRAFEKPSWENTGNAVWDAGMTALSLAPGFGIAKNLGRGASSIEDLRAIEALSGNTVTTPFQSYYLQGDRALGASEAALPQAQALRRFTGQQPLELPAGKPQFFNSEYSELYDDLQRQIDNQKSVSNEIANFNPIDKINKPKVDSETFKRLIMGDDLKFKFDDYPDTPRITGQFQGLEIGRPGTLNAVGETPIPKPSFRPPRGTAQQKALSDLEKLRQQTILGQDEAALGFERLHKQKLKDLKTPEGRRRIQQYIDDNNLKINVDDYINHIEKASYDDMSMWIGLTEDNINMLDQGIKNLRSKKDKLFNDFMNSIGSSDNSISLTEFNKLRSELSEKIVKKEMALSAATKQLKEARDIQNRANARATSSNRITVGNQITNIGDLERATFHETGHLTETPFLPTNSNSVIDRDLIQELDLLDETPEYLFSSINPEEALKTAPYNISHQGINKYRDPDVYFKNAKKYFLEGNKQIAGASNEPTAFAVELRPFLKQAGLIKNDFDNVTPKMVEKLYKEYMSNPEFRFQNLRLFDIIKPNEKSFEAISKALNKIKGIAPYAIPIGLGVGATGLADQGEELQQDMEYAKGGIVTSLSDDEINQYIKDGYIVEEYQEGGQNNLNEYFTIPSNISEIEMYKNSLKPAPKTVQKSTPKTNRPNLNEYFTVPTNWQDLQEKETPKPVEDKKPQYSFSKNYPFINKEYIDEILATNSKSGEKSEKEIVDQYSFSKDYPFINKEYIDEMIKQLPKKETPKKGTKKKSVRPDQAKSMMEILSKYNVTGKTPFFSAPDLANLPKFTEGEMKSAKKDADKRFAEGKKRVKENEVKDSGVLDILGNALATSYYYTTIETPSTSAGKLVESAYDEVQDFFQYAWNGIKRKVQTSGIIDDSDVKVKPLSVTNPLSIEDYYKNRNPIRQQVLDVPNGNGRTYKQQVIPLSNISLGYRNRGDYSKDIKTSGLELTTFHPFTSKPKNITDNTSVFAIDKSGNLHTGKYGDLKSNTDWKFSQTYMNKIKDIRSDFQDGSKSGNSGYWQPKITVIEDGKEKVGSLNLLTKGKGKEDFYGSIQGGRVLFVNPNTKEQFLVSGSLNHIKSEFKRLKGDAPYLEAWTLDNGTYSRGLSYKDGVLTKDRLKSYDLENGSGGNGLYIMNYNAPIHRYEEEYIKGMPNIRTTNSASYKAGAPLKNEVKNVVLHHTAFTDPVKNNQGVHNHFMNPKSEASAHVVIEEDGKRTVYASPEQVTFHAGKSSWNGRSNVNDFAIGVEFQGDTNIKPLTEAQIESFVEYFDDIASKYNLSLKDIITHAMIAPGRKPDITDKEYKRVLKYMKDRGYT